MKKLVFLVLLVLALGFLPVAGQAATVMYDNQAAWAAAVGSFGYVDLPFPTGNYSQSAWTPIYLPAAGSGAVLFDQTIYCAQVPNDWGTWSGGNTPKILRTSGFSTLGAVFTLGQKAFGLEMQPEALAVRSMTLTLEVGNPLLTLTRDVDGNGGASFFGWVSDVGYTSMTLITDNVGYTSFAIGRMAQPVPVPPTLLLLGSGLLGLVGWRRFSKS